MNEVPVHMDERERAQYETLKEEMILRVLTKPKKATAGERNKGTASARYAEGGTTEPSPTFRPSSSEVLTVDAKNASVLCGKLSQLANGAVYSDDGQVARIHDRKLDALEDIIESANGKPVLVAYWYQHDLERIQERLNELDIDFARLDKEQNIRRWNAGDVPVGLIHPASAGHGLNLQSGGNILVWFGLTWSLELYQQTVARLWRQGQQNTVSVIHIITAKTIDERIMDALEAKDHTQSALIDAVKAEVSAYGGK